MARSRQERLPEARHMCVGSRVFSTTRLPLELNASITRPLSSSTTLPPEVVSCNKDSQKYKMSGELRKQVLEIG
jgi:hypothetical protein